jgi:hypothetical protein
VFIRLCDTDIISTPALDISVISNKPSSSDLTCCPTQPSVLYTHLSYNSNNLYSFAMSHYSACPLHRHRSHPTPSFFHIHVHMYRQAPSLSQVTMHIKLNTVHVRVDGCKAVCAKLFVGCCFCYGRLSMSSVWSWSLPSTCGATLSDKLSLGRQEGQPEGGP